MDSLIDRDGDILHSDQQVWMELHEKYETESRAYVERMELERLHAEYGEYVESEHADGVPAHEISSFEEWYEARYLPDFA